MTRLLSRMKKHIAFLRYGLPIICGVLIIGMPSAARADCSAPEGIAGEQIYNSTHNVMQYCNGTNWIAMSGGGGDDTLSGLSCADGQVVKWSAGGSEWICAADVDTDTGDNLGNHIATTTLRGDTHNTFDLGTSAIRWRNGYFSSNVNVNGSTEYAVQGATTSTTHAAVLGQATASTGTASGVWGLSSGSTGSGVRGYASSGTGINYGGRFETGSVSGRAVYGHATAATGTTYGGYFLNNSSSGYGVLGQASAATGTTYGGYFSASSSNGMGVRSYGGSYGGFFEAANTEGSIGVYGRSLVSSGVGYGGYFSAISPNGFGLYASAGNTGSLGESYGVYGISFSSEGYGVYGYATGANGYGVYSRGNAHVEGDLDVSGIIRAHSYCDKNGTNCLQMNSLSCADGQIIKRIGGVWACEADNSGGGADNLGNHTATQNVVLGSNYLSGDGGNEGIRIDAAGNVGIGRSDPSQLLDVYSASADAGINIETGSTYSFVNFKTASGASTIGRGSGIYLTNYDAQPIRFQTNGIERMRVAATGNIGIGKPDPVEVLDVNGTIVSRGQRALAMLGDVDQAKWMMHLGSYDLTFYSDNNNTTKLAGVGDQTVYSRTFRPKVKMTETGDLEVAGKVGIGTTSPAWQLHIADATAPVIQLQETSVNSVFLGVDGGHFFIRSGTIGTPDSFTISSNGNVGIGTTAPSTKLQVAGDVTATAYYQSSDRNMKTDIQVIDDPFALLRSIEGKHFIWKDSRKPAYGVIAQDVEEIMPEAVQTNNDGTKTVEYGQLIAPLIEAIKQLEARVNALEIENTRLKGE